MINNITGKNSIFRRATLILVAFGFVQLVSVGAQSRGETIVTGQTSLAGLARGEMMRFTAFNPATTETGHPNEMISLKLKLLDAHGVVIAESAAVEIPPGEFRSVDFRYDDLPIAGEPDTTRKQVRTVPLWGVRATTHRFFVPTALDLINISTGAGEFRFFFTVEALP